MHLGHPQRGHQPGGRGLRRGWRTSGSTCRRCSRSGPGWLPCGWRSRDIRSEELLDYLCQRLDLPREHVFFSKAPLGAWGTCTPWRASCPPESAAALCYTKYTPQWPAGLSRSEKMIPQILRRDALLFYPYHSMDPFLHLVREAANDPSVLAIKITIYRLASNGQAGGVPVPRRRKTARMSLCSWSCGPALTSRTTSTGPSGWRRRAAPCIYGFERLQGPLQDLPHHPAGARPASSTSPRSAPATTTRRPPSCTPISA